MKVFLNAILVHTILNLYVFWRGWKIIPQKKAWKYSFAGIFIIELIVYLTGFIFYKYLPDRLLHYIMVTGTTWMVFIMYMTMLLILSDLVWILSLWIKKIAVVFDINSYKVRRYYYIISVIVVVIVMARGSYKFWHPEITEYNIVINKKTPHIDKLKIAVVSDIHVGYLIDRNILEMYIDRIMEQNADIILVVGDIIDYDLSPLQKQKMDEEFRRLKAPLGVYASTGNHEYRLNVEDKIQWLIQDAGLNVLRDSVIKINDSFYLLGREDDTNRERKPVQEIIKGIDKSLPIIEMNHEPIYLVEEFEEGIDIVFSGHTHDGQLFPNNLFVKAMYMLSHGYEKIENTHLFVTSGLGLSGPQFRIGTKSEILIVNVDFK